MFLSGCEPMEGRLVDGRGRPAAKGRIQALLPDTARSDLPPDSYGIWFVPPERTWILSRRAVVDEESATFTYALPPHWSGDVVLLLDGQAIWSRALPGPVPGIEIDLDSLASHAGTGIRVEVRTRPAGAVRVELAREPFFPGRSWTGAVACVTESHVFRYLRPGRYLLSVSGEDIAGAICEVVAEAGRIETVPVSLAQGHEIRVSARREDGTRVQVEADTVAYLDETGRRVPVLVTSDGPDVLISGVMEGSGWVVVEGNAEPVAVPAQSNYEVLIPEDGRLSISLDGPDLPSERRLPVDLAFLREGRLQVFPVATYYFEGGRGGGGVTVKIPPGYYVIEGRSGNVRWTGAVVVGGFGSRVALRSEPGELVETRGADRG